MKKKIFKERGKLKDYLNQNKELLEYIKRINIGDRDVLEEIYVYTKENEKTTNNVEIQKGGNYCEYNEKRYRQGIERFPSIWILECLWIAGGIECEGTILHEYAHHYYRNHTGLLQHENFVQEVKNEKILASIQSFYKKNNWDEEYYSYGIEFSYYVFEEEEHFIEKSGMVQVTNLQTLIRIIEEEFLSD